MTESPQSYLERYQVIDSGNGTKTCETQAQRLYSLILNRFTTSVNPDMAQDIVEYQQRFHVMLEDLREQDESTINAIFDYLAKTDYRHVCDSIILCWCLPRPGCFFSKRMYNNCYRDYINDYNHKLVSLIGHPVIRDFCIETLTKTNSIPVHCIDYLWFYMNNLSYDFSFHNYAYGDYIRLTAPDQDDCDGTLDHSTPSSQVELGLEGYIGFSFNLQYLLEMGLGRTSWPTDPMHKGSFIQILEKFVTDPNIVTDLLSSATGCHYRAQLEAIISDPERYLGSGSQIPDQVQKLVQN